MKRGIGHSCDLGSVGLYVLLGSYLMVLESMNLLHEFRPLGSWKLVGLCTGMPKLGQLNISISLGSMVNIIIS